MSWQIEVAGVLASKVRKGLQEAWAEKARDPDGPKAEIDEQVTAAIKAAESLSRVVGGKVHVVLSGQAHEGHMPAKDPTIPPESVSVAVSASHPEREAAMAALANQ